MPIARIFTIRPQERATVMAGIGRATHAAILGLVAEDDSTLAARVHADALTKPITISSLRGMELRGEHAIVEPEQTYDLRVTMLSAELEQLAASWTAERIPSIQLNGVTWSVERVAAERSEHPWAGKDSFEGLIGPALRRPADAPARWTIEFASPVTFRRRGINTPIPLPELVFGSLLDRWNAMAPIPLPDDLRTFVADNVAISRFNIRSTAVEGKAGALQIGAIGSCTYVATTRDRYWLTCLETLARFAFYGGIGAGTTRGFGQARLVMAG